MQETTKSWTALTCGKDGSVRVWDLSAHDNTANLGSEKDDSRHHRHIVKEIIVFPDGSKALSCSYDKTAKVWCLRTGCCLLSLEGHSSNVNECCLFPDSRNALTASKDGTIKIWDLETGECQLTLGKEQHIPPNGKGELDEIRGCGIFDKGQKVRAAPLAVSRCVHLDHHSHLLSHMMMHANRSFPVRRAAKFASLR